MKEIKTKKSFLTLLIATCLILTTTFVTNIPAEGESCLNNLNTTFLSNAEELVEVQATRLVNDELNTATENWTLAELNEFLEDLEDDQGEDEDGDLEFKPGYLSADQTFTAMVSYGFIPEGSRDLEAYRELYHDPYSLEGNVSLSRNFQVLKQYGFIPESLSLSDFRKLGRTGLIIRGFEYPIPTPPLTPPTHEIIWEEDWLDGDVEDTTGGKVATDSNNNVIVYVFSESIGQNIIIKYDSNGNLIWQIPVNDSDLDNVESVDLELYVQEPSMPLGYENCTNNITRVSNNGSLKLYGIYSICTDKDNNIILVGDLWNSSSQQNYVAVFKYDQNGNEIWKNKYDYNNMLVPGDDSVVDSDGNIFIPCSNYIWSYVLKLNSDGSFNWLKPISLVPFWYSLSIALDSNKNPVASTIYSLDNPYGPTFSIRLTKFDSDTGDKIVDGVLEIPNRGTTYPDTALAIDTTDNSVFFGMIDMFYKISPSFDTIEWQKYYTCFIFDLKIIDEKLIACGGWYTVGDVLNYYGACYNKNSGNLLLHMPLGELLYCTSYLQQYSNHLKGISIDNQGNLLYSGGQGGIRVLKVCIT